MSDSNLDPERKRHILITDDDHAIAASTARVLTRSINCECTTVHSVDDAISAIEAGEFDALLTDMVMPERSGLELVREVVQRWPRLPIVVMTGCAEDFSYMDLMKEGAADFIPKPFNPEELAAKFVRLFREKDSMEQLLADLDRLRKLNVAQALSERKYRSLFQYGMNGMVLVSLEDLEIEEVNDAFFDLLGKPVDAPLPPTLSDMLDENDALRFRAALSHFRTTGQGTLAGLSFKTDETEPIVVDVSMSFVTLENGPMLMLMCKDVTEQREMQQKISDMATKDELTGLFNYRMLFVEIDAAIGRARYEQKSAALIYIDLDNFKTCNDTHGHQVGDTLLKSVGEIIQKHIRGAADRGFRYGGDEFAVLLSGIEVDIAMRVADRIRVEFDQIDGYGTSMSIGVAALEDDITGEEWLRRADAALYASKHAGKNQVSLAPNEPVES